MRSEPPCGESQFATLGEIAINSRHAATDIKRHGQSKTSTSHYSWLLVMAVLLAGFNMRPAVTSIPSLLEDIRDALPLSPTMAGLLIALPTLCFGIFSFIVPRLVRLAPANRLIVVSMIITALGCGGRVLMGIPGLLVGTMIASIGISVMSVLVPAIAKHTFTNRLGLIMGLYTMSFSLGGGLGAGLSAPLAQIPGSNWQWSLAFWVIPALAGALCWTRITGPLLASQQPASGSTSISKSLWRDPLAWQITLFMGLQSSLGHSATGWLPSILIDRGMDPVKAGVALSAALMIQLVSNFAAPWLAERQRDQRAAVAMVVSIFSIGLTGVLFGPMSAVWLWVILMGLGMGGCFSLGLSLIVLRSPSSQHATALSSQVQGVGYIIAAIGPFLIGVLYQHSGSWLSSGIFLLLICLIVLWAGLKAGKKRYVLEEQAVQ